MCSMKIATLLCALSLAAAAFAASKPEEFKTSAGTLTMTPIQHAGLMLQAGGQVIHIDPAQGSYDGFPPADLILITDIHGDHLSAPTIAKVKKASTVIIGPEAVAKSLARHHHSAQRRNQDLRRLDHRSHPHVQPDARPSSREALSR